MLLLNRYVFFPQSTYLLNVVPVLFIFPCLERGIRDSGGVWLKCFSIVVVVPYVIMSLFLTWIRASLVILWQFFLGLRTDSQDGVVVFRLTIPQFLGTSLMSIAGCL